MSDDVSLEGVTEGAGGEQGASAEPAEQNTPGTSGGSLLSGALRGESAQPAEVQAAHKDNPQAPEKYDLKVPEGMYTEEQLAVAQQQFRDLGLDNDAAQKLMDTAVANQQQAREQQYALVQRWGDEVRMDKEMGGPALDATLMQATSVLRNFDNDGKVFGMLEETGYSNHPEVIRFLSRIGKSLGEDGVVTGKTTEQEKPLWERLYPTDKK